MSGSVGLLAFAVEGRRLALELDAVERVVRMVAIAPLPGAPEGVLGAVDVAGELVPVLDVRRRFELGPREPGPDDTLVLARTSRRPVALPADEVLGLREVPAAALAPAEAVRAHTRHVAGAVTLEDGLLVVQDLDAFLSADEEQRLEPALVEASGDG
jgi:purine-binding chemotaxis protein CheW